MTRGGLTLGRVGGVAIVIQPLWIAIVALMTWTLGADYFPGEVDGISSEAAYGLGLLSALLLFAGIVLHELGHAIVARRRGVEVDEVDLWLLGGVAKLRGEPQRAVDELAFASAGPAVTAVLLAAFVALDALLPADPAWLDATIRYQVFVCAAILALNLLPAFPLDGGRILRAAVWWKTGRHAAATELAGRVGAFFATVLIALGALSVLVGNLWGLWTLAIGAFLLAAGRAEQEQEHITGALGEMRASDLIRGEPVTIPAALSVDEAVTDYFARHLYTAFPVVDEQGRAVGLVTIAQVRALPPRARSQRAVGSLAFGDPQLLVAADTPAIEVLRVPAFGRTGRAVVVDAGGRPLGIVSLTDVQRTLRARELIAT